MKNDANPTPPRPAEDAKGAEARKPYEAPELIRWGTLHALTQSVGFKGASDGARRGHTRTSF
ncbi:MAG: lasso RiPP family leader peptide-containing protein [Proteobacteria bacterium]|nr:lasso RiPP family leader peptide-containing protein [Pseudomonadota bacterium]